MSSDSHTEKNSDMNTRHKTKVFFTHQDEVQSSSSAEEKQNLLKCKEIRLQTLLMLSDNTAALAVFSEAYVAFWGSQKGRALTYEEPFSQIRICFALTALHNAQNICHRVYFTGSVKLIRGASGSSEGLSIPVTPRAPWESRVINSLEVLTAQLNSSRQQHVSPH